MPHLAQCNIAKPKYPVDHPGMKEFMDNLENINSLAESSPGFIWRLQDDSGDATSIRAFDDLTIMINMSVWTDVDSLKHFVYKTNHVEFFKKRHLWFENPTDAYTVLWWIEEGHLPDAEESKERLQSLQAHGETEFAFTFKKTFEPVSS